VLAQVADRVFTAFPDVLQNSRCVGNPLRAAFTQQPAAAERFAGRSGPLKLLVVGGSLGARALNELVPKALALIHPEQRPQVIHQSGAAQIDALRTHYAAAAFTQQPAAAERFAGRSGPLKLLVVGGSLGARALNELVPKALALIHPEQRPQVIHQSGAAQIDALRTHYAAAGVSAELTPFIDDTAQAFADADVLICRAGASTVTELAAVGAAAVFVPFPAAVDDHQTVNARFLVEAGGGWLMPQANLTPESLASLLQSMDRSSLLERAQAAARLKQINATASVVAACEELTS